jgi:hypothetical protein
VTRDMAHRQPHAHLVDTSRRDPIAIWSERLELVLFVVGLLGILFVVVVLAPGGAA